jgi:catechol 2,3-dioxygenase-like lactoylglutathione lyase family enzyme
MSSGKKSKKMTLKDLTPNIMVEDVSKTIDFYRDVLGFTVQSSVPADRPLVWASLRRDEVQIMLHAAIAWAGRFLR